MPRKGMSTKEKERHDEIYKRYGGYLYQPNIAELINRKHHSAVERFVEGLPVTKINGRKAWRASDIAKKLEGETRYPV